MRERDVIVPPTEIAPPIVYYLGCFADAEERALPDSLLHSDEMTHQLCFAHCSNGGFRYAGLQYSIQCFCGRDGVAYDIHGQREETECRSTCRGDADQICGGAWRMNIYALHSKSVKMKPRAKI